MKHLILGLLLSFQADGASEQNDAMARLRAEWNRPAEPFPIVGNVYYVGTAGLSAYLITTDEGHVLIDGALEESAGQIAANIRRLGFRLEDIRYLLINHAHLDHSGGLAELKRLTGATLLSSVADQPALESGRIDYRDDIPPAPPVAVDGTIDDGSRIAIGGIVLTAHLTPGHTRGCTSWAARVTENGRPLDVVFACSLTVAGQRLVGDNLYPEAAADFRATFAKLKDVEADIYLSFHPEAADILNKRRRVLAGETEAFIDPGELRRRVERAEAAFEREFARQKAEIRGED